MAAYEHLNELRKNKVSILSLECIGKTIQDVVFVKVNGADVMNIVFSDETLLALPVYRDCPVEMGALDDIQAKIKDLLNLMDTEHADNKATVSRLRKGE